MSTNSDDRTVAFQEPTTVMDSDLGGGASGVPRARLICLDTSQVDGGALPNEGQIRLQAGSEQIVGRGDICTFVVPSRKLSRQHARIFAGVNAWGVEDMNSTNGIQVNREKVKTAWLKDGDEVRFGPIPFRFEIDRSDLRASTRPAAPAPEEGAEDRTMMVGSLGAGRAVLEAAHKEELPPQQAPVRTQAPAGKTEGKGMGAVIAAVAIILVLTGLGVGGYFYYPIYMENQTIAATIDRNQPVVENVIERARDWFSSNTGTLSEQLLLADARALEPVTNDLNTALQANPNRPELANLYARARVLQFERAFSRLMANGAVSEARERARDMGQRLRQVNNNLGEVADKDKAAVLSAIRLSDLAIILADYRAFVTKFPAETKPGEERAVPTREELDAVSRLYREFTDHRRFLNLLLRRDYLLFNVAINEFEQDDYTLVTRWQQYLNAN